jgi:hypothetical protein
MPSAAAATVRPKTLALAKAGAIAFSRTGDPIVGEFADAVMLFEAGEVPDTVFDRERDRALGMINYRPPRSGPSKRLHAAIGHHHNEAT